MDSAMRALRAREFSRLDANGQTYLDYTGGGLYAESQIREQAERLLAGVYGNPHSQNPASLASTHFVEAARQRVRAFFDADPDEYEVVFTLNASGALKIVGESYPFGDSSRYVLLADDHNSVNGIREFAQARGAQVTYIPLNAELRVDPSTLEEALSGADAGSPNLFAYPAQSNFSGVKHPLSWIEMAQGLGYEVLLDVAAYAPTSRLSLREVKPDFATLSFYKMFGYPTGVGALLCRRDVMHKMVRPWFGGGTVRFVSAQNKLHLLQPTGEAFEDGTLNYLSIPGIITGLDFLDEVGMERINVHVMAMTGLLLDRLLALRHSNGVPLVEIYGPKTNDQRGGTVALNVFSPDGDEVDCRLVESRANENGISVRSGCFCNPGAAESAFEYQAVQAYQCFEVLKPEKFTLQQFSSCMNDKPVGAVRVSVGIATNEADIERLIDLLKTFVDYSPEPGGARTVPQFVGP
jgi:molybdenum cofactor sulfurtransferase